MIILLNMFSAPGGSGSFSGALVEGGDTVAGVLLTGYPFSGALVEGNDSLAGVVLTGYVLAGALTQAGDTVSGSIVLVGSVGVVDPNYTVVLRPLWKGNNRYRDIAPAARPSLSLDFEWVLPADVTIDSVQTLCAVHPASKAVDALAATRLQGVPNISADRKMVSQFFMGGLAEVIYVISYRATYSNGETIQADVILAVHPYNNVGPLP